MKNHKRFLAPMDLWDVPLSGEGGRSRGVYVEFHSDEVDFSYILNYVESIANQRISVEQIAAALGYNYDYLRQLFLKKTGMTLKNYIMDARLNNVQKYLLNYDYTLDELAGITGFTSPSHLCMVFKRKFGLSPLEYKLRERKDPKVDNLKQ